MKVFLVALLSVCLALPLSAQATTFTIPPASLAPAVTVFPASGVNGAGVVTSPQLLAPDGTALLPGYAFSAQANTGIWRRGTSLLTFSTNGVARGEFNSTNGFALSAGLPYAWTSGAVDATALDTGISRTAAATFAFGNGTQASTTGSVALTSLVVTTTLFASLGTPANGTWVYCSDCLANSTPCTGSSTGAFAKRLAGAWDCR